MTEYEHVGHEVSKHFLFLLARDIINNKYTHRLDEPGCVGQSDLRKSVQMSVASTNSFVDMTE